MKIELKWRNRLASIDHCDYNYITHFLKSKVNSDLTAIETNSPLVIDQVSIDTVEDLKIFTYEGEELSFEKRASIIKSYDVGIESLSNILASEGVWSSCPITEPVIDEEIEMLSFVYEREISDLFDQLSKESDKYSKQEYTNEIVVCLIYTWIYTLHTTLGFSYVHRKLFVELNKIFERSGRQDKELRAIRLYAENLVKNKDLYKTMSIICIDAFGEEDFLKYQSEGYLPKSF